MLFKTIKNIITTIFFLTSIQSAFSNDLLIPLKKPKLSDEVIIKKITSNIIIPHKKPTKEKKQKIETKVVKKRITKIKGIIVPKNKPLIVKKQRPRMIKKSRYYSDIDLNYARQAIKFMEKGNWRDAKKVAKKEEQSQYMILSSGNIY